MRSLLSIVVGRLWVRLVLAFVIVAIVAEAVFAFVALLTERADVARLASAQHAQVTSAVVSALDNAYRANGGWNGADLRAASALAESSGAALTVTSSQHRLLLRSGRRRLLDGKAGIPVSRSLRTDGRVIAEMRLVFPTVGLTPADERLQSALAQAVALSAALAAAVAVLVALVAARGLALPIQRLSAAASALGSGSRGVRVGKSKGPVELGELARTFDSMAASLERHEDLRRAMVADVAHELRTPVAILQAETELLVDGSRRATPEALLSLHDETLRLGHLVQDFQTMASADAAGLRLERSWVDLSVVAASAASSFESQFTTCGVDFRTDLSPAIVWGDPDRLRQVVANLLSNAAKFTPVGGCVRLGVSSHNGCAELVVSDTGPGVPTQERAHVFDRFYRGSAGRRAGGSGIGLAVVRDLVEAHGGSVVVEGPLRGGATFSVRLPLNQPESSA